MKPRRLYIKIFLSFVLVLIVTELLIFGFFAVAVGRKIRSSTHQHVNAQVLMARTLVEDSIKTYPATIPSENKALRDFLVRMGEIFSAKVWLSDPEGNPLVTSFAGSIPQDLVVVAEAGAEDLGNFRMYRDFGRDKLFYVAIPTEISPGSTGTLHLLYEREFSSHPGGAFAVGLVVIGVVIALLLIPVSRRITGPIKQLGRSALRIAEGDLSHRASIKSKDEIGELGRSFNHMTDRLEKMIQGGKELTANVSHELRSPLARIRVAEELIRTAAAQGNHQDLDRHLNDIRDDIEELDRLIGSILLLSKLDLREAEEKREPFDPSIIIDEIVARFRPLVDRKQIDITADFPSASVLGEKETFRTALSNVLDNAVKFTPTNGRITVEMYPEKEHLIIRITNTCNPLSKEELSRIFEPFYRTEGAAAAGSGLGLAIVKKIVDRWGGMVEAANAADGFCIQLILPSSPD